jgi:menaquinone-specific isochorismate synthase
LQKLPTPNSLVHNPDKSRHAQILAKFYHEPLQKAVVARSTTLSFTEPPDLSSMIHNLLRKRSSTHLFALILSPTEAFFGLTPESLFILNGNKITTEALAGTRRLHSDKDLFNPKELLEFRLTRDKILKDLKEQCNNITYKKDIETKRTGDLEHLHTKIKATLKKGVGIDTLIASLHPTPALGGVPKKQALEFIYNTESFDRGLFAAPFCLSYDKKAHCLVAIRSALLQNKELHIFAGSGCVKGSCSEDEFQELNDKCAPFLHQFAFTKE